jgi:hypothetical protein
MSEQGEGCVVGFSVALAGSRGLAAGIRGYAQAVYPRRSADKRLPVATYPLEYVDRLRGYAAYPREYGDRLWQFAAHRQKSGDRPYVAVDCDVGAPAKAGKRQQVRTKSSQLRIRQVLPRKESIHREVTSCVAWGDPRGEA